MGGLIGAAGSYLAGDRLRLPVLQLGPLRQGVRTARFGPVQDPQFGYVVLGRAVDHWWHVSQRNHAGRDLLTLAPADQHWLTGLDRASRQAIHRAFERPAGSGRWSPGSTPPWWPRSNRPWRFTRTGG